MPKIRQLSANIFGLSKMLAPHMRSNGQSQTMLPHITLKLGCADCVLLRSITSCLNLEEPPLIRGLNFLHHVITRNLNFQSSKSENFNFSFPFYISTYLSIYLLIIVLQYSSFQYLQLFVYCKLSQQCPTLSTEEWPLCYETLMYRCLNFIVD